MMAFDLYELLLLGMFLYLATGLLASLLGARRRLAGWVNFAGCASAGLVLLRAAWEALFLAPDSPSKLIAVGPVSLYFLVDGLSAFFLALIGFLGAMAAWYSVRYMDHYPGYGLRGYYLAFPLFLLGMAGVVTVDDLTSGFTLAWQLMTLASYFLVRFEHRVPGNVGKANRYLLLMEAAWLAVVGSVFLVGGTAWGAPLHRVVEALAESTPITAALACGLLLFGFAMKAGVFPLGQLWLPDAHSIAPSPVSALLSGVMLKTGIYGILRTFLWMAPAAAGSSISLSRWGTLIAGLGVVTLFIGTVQSMKQSDAKRLLAYSSIGQIGYVVFAVGAALVMFHSTDESVRFIAPLALVGAAYHVLNHAVFKGLLFLNAGSVLFATGSKDLNRLGGLIRFMPVTAVLAGIGSLAISGVPSLSGFASKWTIVATSLLSGSDSAFLLIAGVIALFTSTITLSCYVKFFGMTFTSAGTEWNLQQPAREVGAAMLAPKTVLAILCVVQGLFPAAYWGFFARVFERSAGSFVQPAFAALDWGKVSATPLLGVQASLPGRDTPLGLVLVPLAVLAVLLAGLAAAHLLRRSAGSRERTVPTWLCGYQELNNNNRYLDRNLFAALRSALRWTGGNSR